MRREDQQVDTSVQGDPGNPLLYVFFKDNAQMLFGDAKDKVNEIVAALG